MKKIISIFLIIKIIVLFNINEYGISLSVFGQLGIHDGQFNFPKDVAISNDGYLFVTDTQGNRIQKFCYSCIKRIFFND